VVSIYDSTRTMKLALFVCDLLTILIVWRWLPLIGRPAWLVVAYAWNPLVVLEIAHSGHIDALGALWTVASAYWLTRRRTALASIALVMAIATKLLPIVLLPLFWGRVRVRDAFVGATFLALLYVLYTQHGVLPFGAVPNVVAYIRFNGPLFRAVAQLSTPQAAAAFAVTSGLIVAAWCRWKRGPDDPSSWAWPMAIALAGAPVIYPWYLLYLTPFLMTIAALPLATWTLTVISTYIVWQFAYERGARWAVPSAVMAWEYALPALVAVLVLGRSRIDPFFKKRQTDAAKAADSVEGIT
jgi:alpha-1,6-mannosyltransferase